MTISLLVVFCNFLFNGKYISFRMVRYFNVRGHGRRARPDCNMLALLDNIHELVIIPSIAVSKGST